MPSARHPVDRRKERPHLADALLVGLFALAVVVANLETAFGFDPIHGSGELRRPASWAAVAEAARARPWNVAAMIGALRDAYADHMGFRSSLLRLRARVDVELLGVSPTDKVILGRDGWAYWAAPESRASYRRLPFAPTELRRVVAVLQSHQRHFTALGARYVVVIVPDKATVHPEFLPSRWRPASGPSRVDALAVAATAVDIDVVDLRGALRQAARERITYDAMGTHWNEYGAFVGYRALLQAAGVSDERLLPASALRAEPADGGDSGLAVALGLGPRPEAGTIRMAWKQAPTARDALRPVAFAGTGDPRHAITASLRPGTEGPRVALIRDSFGRQLRGFFAETFPAVLFVWSRTLALSATEAAAVERFAPDLVIELFVERSLYEDAGQFQPLP